MSFSMAMPWHEGEEKMHRLLQVPERDNPTATMLTPQLSFMLQRGPLLALGTLDAQSRPWTTLWGGGPGFSEPLGGGLIGTRTLVDSQNDPVVQALVGDAKKGEMLQPQNGGKLLSGLAIDLMSRKRVKLAGRMVGGIVTEVDVDEDGEKEQKQDAIQLVTKIEQSLDNCPKYLNQYEIRPALLSPKLLSNQASLSEASRALISKSDLFFLTTSTATDMDTNHRGGPPGFVRIISATQIVYPEYSGNRLYQSLGNLQVNPKIGITFPNLSTGDVLYITGTAAILVGLAAATLLPGSTLAVVITIRSARHIQLGLPFRGTRKTPSPYNPPVRTLASEGNIKASFLTNPPQTQHTAHLTHKTLLTPSIARFTFSVSPGIDYKPGQWIALDFSEHLDIGYEHMRDDDPKSLNDDFVRTFTISSTPGEVTQMQESFEITIRKVGRVTGYLFKQNVQAGFEVPVRGVGGEFEVRLDERLGRLTGFVAGGVGITPLLGQLGRLRVERNRERFKLLWTLRGEDVLLVKHVMKRFAGLAACSWVFFTGDALAEGDAEVERLEGMGVRVFRRRLGKSDVDGMEAKRWCVCAGKMLRSEVIGWLPGREVVFEDFDY